jgi:glucosamine--fructose-6-phosphate aminotransferase (isomerizing)
MCGIVGYYGKDEKVLDVLISGLKRLEYRGYDSAGVAILTKNEDIFYQKESGKIVNLEKAIQTAEIPSLKGIGIAHTRWATHGVPNKTNAHPHWSNNKQIFLIHNGIIENYQELKEELIKKGFDFYSQTDTEIVANLIEYYYKDDLKEAVLKSLERVVGAYSLLICCKNEPNRLIAAKKGSPLVMGIKDGEYIFGSDVSPVISHTKDVVYLEDGEIVDIQDSSYEITNLENQSIDKKIEQIEWDEEAASKEGYDHFLLKEIMEQPKVIQDSIRGRLIMDSGNVKFGGLIDIMDQLKKIKRVVILGIGTSFYAAKLGELYFESVAGIPAKAEMSPEFRYNDTAVDEETWVIAMSQSGETADTIAAIEEAKRKGCLVTGIVNTVGSTISRITKAGVYNHIGPEISVASTKAFTSQAALLLMHAVLLGRQHRLGYTDGIEIIKAISELPEKIQEVLEENESIKILAKKYCDSKDLVYVGRKYNYPVALEGALKIKEISYIHAEGLSGGEFKHGFIALIDENLPTIAIVTKDSIYEKMISNIQEIKARSGKIIAVATKGDKNIKNFADDIISVPDCGREEVQPIVNNIALQLLAYHCSHLKGLDVDKPRNLAKSVTVE